MPTIELSSYNGTIGSTIQLNGSGFTANGTWSATFKDASIFSSCPVSPEGNLTQSGGTPQFTVPAVNNGDYQITVVDDTTGANATAFFHVYGDPPSIPHLSFTPDSTIGAYPDIPGTFNVMLRVENATDLQVYETNVVWNQSILELQSYREGNFNNDSSTVFLAGCSEPGRLLELTSGRLSGEGVTGSRDLAVLTFRVIGYGECNISLVNTTLLAEADSLGAHFSMNSTAGVHEVWLHRLGDMNGDNVVGPDDLTAWFTAYSTYQSTGVVNPLADIDDDHDVDYADLTLWAGAYSDYINRNNPITQSFTNIESHDPTDRITVTNSTYLSFSQLPNNDTTYAYIDKGLSYFGHCTHKVNVQPVNHSNGTAETAVWALTNDRCDWNSTGNGEAVFLGWNQTSSSWFLRLECKQGNSTTSDVYSFSGTAWKYLTVVKGATTLMCRVYGDSARTNLLDTLTVSIQDGSYRFVYPVLSVGDGGGSWISGNVSTLITDVD